LDEVPALAALQPRAHLQEVLVRDQVPVLVCKSEHIVVAAQSLVNKGKHGVFKELRVFCFPLGELMGARLLLKGRDEGANDHRGLLVVQHRLGTVVELIFSSVDVVAVLLCTLEIRIRRPLVITFLGVFNNIANLFLIWQAFWV